MGAVKPVGQLYGSPTALTRQCLPLDCYCTYVVQTPSGICCTLSSMNSCVGDIKHIKAT